VATDAVEFILKARDEASATIAKAQSGIVGLTGVVGDLVGKASLIGAATAGIAAIAGGILAAGKSMADTVEQLDRVSARTGVGIEKLQIWSQVIEEGGGSAETLTTALTFLNRAIAQNDPLLGKLGITTKDTTRAFEQLVRILAGSQDAAKRTEVAFQLMGRGSADLLGNLSDLATKSDAFGKSMRETGALITEQVAPSARKLDQQLDALGRQWKGLATSFNTLAVPVASAMVVMFDAILKGAIKTGSEIRKAVIEPLEDLERAAREAGLGAPRRRGDPTEQTLLLHKGDDYLVAPRDMYGITVTAKRKDPIAGLDLSKGGGASKRSKLAQELAALEKQIHQSYQKAVEDAKLETDAFNSALETTNAQMEQIVAGLADTSKGMSELERSALATNVVFLEWQDTAAQITSSAGILDAELRGLWNGLTVAADSAFSQIAARWKYSSNLLNNITHALADEMIHELERIAVAKIFQLILNLASGAGFLSTLSTAASAAAGGGSGHPFPDSAGKPREININVSAFDEMSVIKSLTSPNGALRAAFADAALRRPR
jgi:hypothetical protein